MRVVQDVSTWFAAGNDPSAYGVSDGTVSASAMTPASDFGTDMQTIPASPFQGQQRFSAIVSTTGVASPAWAGLWMRIDDANGNTLAFDNMQQSPIEDTPGYYLKYEVVLPVAPQAGTLNFGMLLSGGGQAWVEDAALEEPVSADDSYDSSPTGWYLTGEDPQHYVTSTDATAGQCGRAVAHFANQGSPTDFGTIMETISAAEFQGKRVRLTTPIKTANAQDVQAWMRVDGPGPNVQVQSFDNMDNRRLVGTLPWTNYAIVLDVPADASEVAFGVLSDGTGDAWVDVVHFEIVPTSVPVTSP